jgi:plastocyanin
MFAFALAAAALAAPTPVGVSAREWRLSTYVPVVRRGGVAFNVHNYGEDPHNLQVRGPRGYRSAVTPDIASEGSATLVVTLRRAGAYRLVCTLPGHVAKGMRVQFRVR